MRCVIIAAGQGTRLRAMAASKPLAEVHGTTLLEHIVRRAKAGGASEFLVVTGYEAERVEAVLPALQQRVGAPVEAVRNPEWHRPNGLSVLAAAPRLTGEFILLMSDHLFDPAILSSLLAGRRAEAALTLASDSDVGNPLLDLDDATKLRLDGERRIVAIGKAITDYNAIDTGIFLASPPLFEAIHDGVAAGGSGSLSEGVARLAAEGRAFGFDIGGRWWLDVDDETGFRRAEAELPSQAVAQ